MGSEVVIKKGSELNEIPKTIPKKEGMMNGQSNITAKYIATKVRKSNKKSPKFRNSFLLHEIQKDVHHLVSEMKETQATEDVNRDWKIVGKILDRLFFVLFLLTVGVSSVAILVPAYLHEREKSEWTKL